MPTQSLALSLSQTRAVRMHTKYDTRSQAVTQGNIMLEGQLEGSHSGFHCPAPGSGCQDFSPTTLEAFCLNVVVVQCRGAVRSAIKAAF